jgi:hypothetical protein
VLLEEQTHENCTKAVAQAEQVMQMGEMEQTAAHMVFGLELHLHEVKVELVQAFPSSRCHLGNHIEGGRQLLDGGLLLAQGEVEMELVLGAEIPTPGLVR